MWEEDFEDVNHVVHGRPCLVDDVEADGARAADASAKAQRGDEKYGCIQFVDVGVEYPVHEADARALVRILIGQFDVDLPETTLEGCLIRVRGAALVVRQVHTLFRPLEPDVKLLPRPGSAAVHASHGAWRKRTLGVYQLLRAEPVGVLILLSLTRVTS